MRERPIVKVEETANTAEEFFQNKVLRPVIKMQHDLLCILFKTYLSKHSIALSKKDDKTQVEIIEYTVRKNKALRAQMIGLILGQFTKEELNEYITHESELSRRVITMIIQRLCSAKEQLL